VLSRLSASHISICCEVLATVPRFLPLWVALIKGNPQTAIQGAQAAITVTGPWARRPEIRCSIPGMATNISSSASRPVLGPNLPAVQWSPEFVSPGKKRLPYEADRQTT
jgi:hypothetical protein